MPALEAEKAVIESGLARIEAVCARALAGDHDKKSLLAALTLAIEWVQALRALVKAS